MFLLDTNVVSETRKPRPHGALIAWLQSQSARNLFVPAIVFGELQAGIELTRKQDPAKAAALEEWIEDLPHTFAVLPMDTETFRVWARLLHGRSSVLSQDAMVAATAIVHKLTVVSRNVRDFNLLGVPVLNPFLYKG